MITAPNSDRTVTNPVLTITGTCKPFDMIKIIRNGQVAGETFCSNSGLFGLDIDLEVGPNGILARPFDPLGIQGPDSSSVAITYHPVTPAGQPKLGTPATSNGATVSAATNPLTVNGDNPYRGYSAGQEITWKFKISGGQSPYAISISWGDGSSSLVSRSESGDFEAKHTYRSAPAQGRSFAIDITASDATGSKAHFHTEALVSDLNVVATYHHDVSSRLMMAWPLWGLAILLVSSFALGEWREKRKLQGAVNLGQSE